MRTLSCGLFSLLFPDECRVCGAPLRRISRIPVCPECLQGLAPLNAEYFCVSCHTPFLNAFPLDESGRCALCRLGVNGYDAAYAYGAYEGTLRKLIHLFKYDRIRPLARPLGEFLIQVLPRDQRIDLVVPMPLHWRKRWQRGFNQSDLLARVVASRWNVPVGRVVRRRRFTAPQAGLSHARRRTNVAGAFRLRRGASVRGLRLLLVDDVLTTGSTASACAQALKRGGAGHITLVTLARVDRRVGLRDLDAEPVAAAGGEIAP